MWGECEAQDGMHFNGQRYVVIELIDPESGEALPWREGASGEIVYTAFRREATPLLRYRSRDHAQVVGVACRCGRTSPRIRCIGRTDDMLIYKGMNVFPTALRDLIATRFAGSVEPMLRIWKDTKEQVRFDDPIAVDVEAAPASRPIASTALRRRSRTRCERSCRCASRSGCSSGSAAEERLQEFAARGARRRLNRQDKESPWIRTCGTAAEATSGRRRSCAGKAAWPMSRASTSPSSVTGDALAAARLRPGRRSTGSSSA